MTVPSQSIPPQLPVAEHSNEPIKGNAKPLFPHKTVLLLSTAILLLAFFLRQEGEEGVLIPFVTEPLPPGCYFKSTVGLDCLGCGLTRCFINMAHGNFSRAWYFHPVGTLFFVLVLFQIPYRLAQIWRVQRGKPEWTFIGGTPLVIGLLFLALFQWLGRLFW
ncbi:MAG: DUF2752 domain-containing protein [Pirellulaceae bacterium]|nr:DUF2752 domain-containing protein [Pirellulaceae bacterium]